MMPIIKIIKLAIRSSVFVLLLIILLFMGCKKKPRFTTPDILPPLLGNASIYNVTNRSATIGWSSNESVLISIEYGTTTAYGQKQANQESGQMGQMYITNLESSTLYYFRLVATDSEGNVTSSAGYSFTTSGSLHHITIEPSAVTMYMEETKLFTASGRDSNDKVVEINPTWSVSNTLATIDRTTGVQVSLISGVSKGTVQITAVDSAVSGSADITIIGGPYDEPPENGVIYRATGGSSSELVAGYEIGLNTGSGKTDWLNENAADWIQNHDYMKMAYPGDAVWGAVFIVVSPLKPLEKLNERKAYDYRGYTKLQLELKGAAGGEKVKIGIKDINDPDDGGETKYLLSGITTDWQTYDIPLSAFPFGSRSQLRQIYVAIEFVWDNDPANGLSAQNPCTIYFRNVQYTR